LTSVVSRNPTTTTTIILGVKLYKYDTMKELALQLVCTLRVCVNDRLFDVSLPIYFPGVGPRRAGYMVGASDTHAQQSQRSVDIF
jgi:hypothetical protein